MQATAFFKLSQAGQKAALLAGKSAAALQSITGEIQPADLDLATIRDDGSVVVSTCVIAKDRALALGQSDTIWAPRNTSGSMLDLALDAPPESAADVFAAIRSEIVAADAKARARKDRDNQERLANLAEKRAQLDAAMTAMEADPNRTPELPYLDYQTEAYAELRQHPAVSERSRRLKELKDREAAAAEAQHQAKRDFIRAWLADHGALDQIERYEAGLLPETEYLPVIQDAAFAPLADFTRYAKIRTSEVLACVDDDTYDPDSPPKIDFRSIPATDIDAGTWELGKRLQAALPGAKTEFRLHQASLSTESWDDSKIERPSIKVTVQYGPFEFTRELAAAGY